MIQSTVR